MSEAILDLRSAQAFALGHAAGAVNIPLEELPSRMHELPEKGAPLGLFHDRADELLGALRFLEARGYRTYAIAAPALDETGPSTARLWRPAPLLVEALQHCAEPARAADLGCGSGREAVYLASLGWGVDAIDVLPDALEKARDLAGRSGVQINTFQLDLRYARLPRNDYSLVTMFRFLDRQTLARAINAIAPKGLLVVESFHQRDPARRGNLLRSGELQELCRGLEVIVHRDEVERNSRWYSQIICRRI